MRKSILNAQPRTKGTKLGYSVLSQLVLEIFDSRYILVYNVIVHKSMLDDSLTRAESRRTLVLDSQLSEILLSFVSVHMCVRENGCSRSKEAAAVVGSRFRNRDAANFSPGYDIKF